MKKVRAIKKAISFLAGAVIMAAPIISQADTEVGNVLLLTGSGGTTVYVFSKTPQSGGTARCSPTSPYGTAYSMVLDISTDGGKALYASLLAADTSGKQVTFIYSYSNGGCTLSAAYY